MAHIPHVMVYFPEAPGDKSLGDLMEQVGQDDISFFRAVAPLTMVVRLATKAQDATRLADTTCRIIAYDFSDDFFLASWAAYFFANA